MEKFTSIDSFTHAISGVRNFCHKFNKPLPVITYEGTVKLHGCFSHDTPVTMADGSYKHIEDLKIGDYILSYDLETNEIVSKEVIGTANASSEKNWLELTFVNEFGERIIRCTYDHKFFTNNHGWVQAIDLTSDDDFVLDA
jgi:hypothetical protein